MTNYQLARQLKIAWLAGIIDGEATIRIHKDSREERILKGFCEYGLRLAVEMTPELTIREAFKVFGCGSLSNRKRFEGRKRLHQWVCCGCEAIFVIKAVFPLLVTKRLQADCAIRFMEEWSEKRDRELMEAFYRQMTALNQVGE
jgi:hypothetical protein